MSSSEDLNFFLNALSDNNKAEHILWVLKRLGFKADDVRLGFVKKLFENTQARYGSWTKNSYDRYHGVTKWIYGSYDFAHIVYNQLKDELAFRNTFWGNVVVHANGEETFFRRISSLAKEVRTNEAV